MVQESRPGVAAHNDEWRRRAFRVLEPDGTSHIPELPEVATEEGRIFEFYANLFESTPESDDESVDNLVERFDSSPALLNGIPLERVVSFPGRQFDSNKAALLSGEGDFEHLLEVAYYWLRVREVADSVKSRMATGEV